MTDAPGTVVPLRLVAPAAPLGYLGLIQKTVEVDWATVAEHGPSVFVQPRSPARAAGLRNGDYVVSINDLPFDVFYAKLPPPGTQVRIIIFRAELGRLTAYALLKSPPKPKRVVAWERMPAILPGRVVGKKDRPKYLDFITKYAALSSRETHLLTVLLNMEWHEGIIPSHATIAGKMHCSVPTVKRSIARCMHFGCLQVTSGKGIGRTNSYQVCSPSTTAGRSRG